MTTIAIPLPRTNRPDDCAFILNRAIAADDDAMIAIFDAFADPDSSPIFADLLRGMRANFSIFRAFCLDLDICPIHETDIDTCLDDDLDCTKNGYRIR